MKKGKKWLSFCPTCSVKQADEKKSWLSNICIGHVGLFVAAVIILIMELNR